MKKNLYIALLFALMLSACSINFQSPQMVEGSGVRASEGRAVSGFDSIELAGSADVSVSFGDNESVIVEADDNILPLIETNVRGGTLEIHTRPNTNLRTQLGIRVMVTMKSLQSASLPGSGNISIDGLQGQSVDLSMQGSGNITAQGMVERVNITLDGSGNFQCDELQAKSASIEINGSGNVFVYASESLRTSINGSGNVQYRGNPENVEKSVSGSGNVIPIP
jgi:hypothetical protein